MTTQTKITKCDYCNKIAVRVIQYRGFIAARPTNHYPLITVAACSDHVMCPNFVAHENKYNRIQLQKEGRK